MGASIAEALKVLMKMPSGSNHQTRETTNQRNSSVHHGGGTQSLRSIPLAQKEVWKDKTSALVTGSIVTSPGKITNLKLPRLCKGRLQTGLRSPYSRRIKAVEITILESFLCGIATRKMKRVLRSILGTGAPSSMSVSRIVTWLNHTSLQQRTCGEASYRQ